MRAFITGTDTGVGKTYFAVLLAGALRRAGWDVRAFKPVCCGGRDDAVALREASGCGLSLEEVNPLWLPDPVAPAATSGQPSWSLDNLAGRILALAGQNRPVLVEGAGGWLVPLNARETMADLATRLGYPVIIVVPNRLGCLNHTLLTLEAIRARGLVCQGLVLNSGLPGMQEDGSQTSNRRLLELTTGLPVLTEISASQSASQGVAEAEKISLHRFFSKSVA